MKVTRGVIFDCDGVLFESRTANLAYYNAVLDNFGVAPVIDDENDRQRAHLYHTASSPIVFSQLLGDERVDTALSFAATLGFQQFMPYMTPEPGLREVLTTLSENALLAVATNRGDSMHEILEHFELRQHFSVIVTSRDVERPKPYPDMLQLAAQQLRVNIDELVFVGDSNLDQEAAQGAGMRFIGYQNSFPRERCVTHLHELPELIEGWRDDG